METMNKKKLAETMILTTALAWVPALVVAFLWAPWPVHIKALIISAASFITMIIWMLKHE